MQHKIVLVGGPGTGKSSVLDAFKRKGFTCMPEVSREVTIEARQNGVEQLFLKDPLLFSFQLLKKREQQFIESEKLPSKIVFFDRGIPTIKAYLELSEIKYPKEFTKKSKKYKYTNVFEFLPWQKIYKIDNERYEDFEQAQKISAFIRKVYKELKYEITSVPFGSVEDRCNFILNKLKIGK